MKKCCKNYVIVAMSIKFKVKLKFSFRFSYFKSKLDNSKLFPKLRLPSAQCVYHIWIRSAGNVSISFSLWRGDRGHGVHCEGVQRKARAQGGSSGSIQPERCVLLHSFYTLFAPKQRKRMTFAF